MPYRSRDGARSRTTPPARSIPSIPLLRLSRKAHPARTELLCPPERVSQPEGRLWCPPRAGLSLPPPLTSAAPTLYGALLLPENITESHEASNEPCFHTAPPMPAAAQKETFQNILQGALWPRTAGTRWSRPSKPALRTYRRAQGEQGGEPLKVSKGAVKCVLKSRGVSESHLESFDAKYDDGRRGTRASSPRNLRDTKAAGVRTPDVTIRVNPERSDFGGDPHHRRRQVHPHPRGRGRGGQRCEYPDSDPRRWKVHPVPPLHKTERKMPHVYPGTGRLRWSSRSETPWRSWFAARTPSAA